jgi:hypothetical protein
VSRSSGMKIPASLEACSESQGLPAVNFLRSGGLLGRMPVTRPRRIGRIAAFHSYSSVMLRTSRLLVFIALFTIFAQTPQSQAGVVCHTPQRFTAEGFPLPVDSVMECRESSSKVVLGFFNGVANSDSHAQESMNAIKKLMARQFAIRIVDYQVFYNQTGCRSGIFGRMGCLEDLAEVFSQRQAEFDVHFRYRWEFFWDVLDGRYAADGSWTAQVVRALESSGQAAFDLMASAAAAVEARLIAAAAGWIANPPTSEDQVQHAQQLKKIVSGGNGALLIAHSQGNLFANHAFDTVMRQTPEANVRVAHVAPASAFLRGEYVLGTSDVVIGALRVTTSGRVPANNVLVTGSRIDPSGHRFIDTYLDETRAAYIAVVNVLRRALTSV